MAVEIKILQHGDEVLLASVAPEVFDDSIDTKAAALFLADRNHHIVVALRDNTVIGFASAVTYLHPDKTHPELWINEVGVAPEHQSHGIGKALMNRLLDHARTLGCMEAWVLTEKTNTPAIRLYSSVGGEETPERPVMFTFQLDGNTE
jgi:ribosomal protein S18 acetylase RimI-like enzyme